MMKEYMRRVIVQVLLLCAASISCTFFADNASGSQNADILAVGEGLIKENNVAEARKAAISDALKNGIEQYLTRYLGSQGMTGNFTTLINNVVPYAGEDIENYHILAEDRKDDIYSILVKIKVNEQLMEQRLNDFGIVSIDASSIRVLFLVYQERTDGKGLSFWWNNPEGNPALTTTELKLYNIFQEQGVEPINRLANIPSETYTEDMMIQDLSNEAALKWGRIFSADIIVKGGCILTDENTVSVDLESIKVANGELICRSSREEQIDPEGMESDMFVNSIERAVYAIAVQFVPQIIKSFEKANNESIKIPVKIEDVNNFEEFSVLKKFIEEEIDGVKSVVQSRIKGNSMTVSVEFSGTRDEFINRLKGNKGFPVQADITDVEDVQVIIAIEHEMLDSGSDRNYNIQ